MSINRYNRIKTENFDSNIKFKTSVLFLNQPKTIIK